MATKSARVIELEEAIAQAVATLDESDGSRIGASEAIDAARETLADGYGTGFENAVTEYLSDGEDDDDASEEEDETE
jgi:hypothetical protein